MSVKSVKQITLATLADATAQEVFDQVAKHLLTQNKVSVAESGACQYRNEGLKCAAGCLIGDDEYEIEMDLDGYPAGLKQGINVIGSSWDDLILRGLVPTTKHDCLIGQLQILHDGINPRNWHNNLKELAYVHNVTFNAEAYKA